MRDLRGRIERMERLIGDRACIACARTPHNFLIQNAADEAKYQERMRERAEQCTCGRTFHVRKTIVHLEDEEGEGANP